MAARSVAYMYNCLSRTGFDVNVDVSCWYVGLKLAIMATDEYAQFNQIKYNTPSPLLTESVSERVRSQRVCSHQKWLGAFRGHEGIMNFDMAVMWYNEHMCELEQTHPRQLQRELISSNSEL